MYKETEPYVPINGRQQDRHFPAIEKLDYENYIVAINETPANVEY
jgi:hypothetical protein